MQRSSRLIAGLAAIGFLGSSLAAPAPMVVAAPCADPPCHALVPTIAFTSTRDRPTLLPQINAAEIYLMNLDGTNVRRLTDNVDGDGFPVLDPTGRRVIFDSNRLRAGGPILTFDLFVASVDEFDPIHLTAGSSATWSPDGHHVAYHRSASGSGTPIRPDPGAPPSDSDIFIINVDGALELGEAPRNLTVDPARIDDDADWSPDGTSIAFTSQPVGDDPANPTHAEIFTMPADGSAPPVARTANAREERSPEWSPDGARIVYSCRLGDPPPNGTLPTFEICVMDADGTDEHRLTTNGLADLAPSWSPDGARITFQRPVGGRIQIWSMAADGTDQRQLTDGAGINLSPNTGLVRDVHTG